MKRRLVAALAVLAIASTGCAQMNQREVTTVVKDKERICETQGDCKYLVFTEAGTFENVDALTEGKFDSSDLQGEIEVGQEYTFLVAGYRQGVLSMYPNILEIVE